MLDVDTTKYPQIVHEVMEYIMHIRKIDEEFGKPKQPVLDIIYSFCLKHNYEIEMVGDAIKSDIYFKNFVETDCKINKIIKSNINEMEDW